MEMKRLFLTIVGAVVALVAAADCLQEGMIWQADCYIDRTEWPEYPESEADIYAMELRYIQGDTIVGGKTYHKIYSRMFSQGSVIRFPQGCSPTLFSLLREDNGRIYQIQNHGDIEGRLIFDFSLSVGEKVEGCVLPKSLIQERDYEPLKLSKVAVEEFEVEMFGRKYTCKWIASYDGAQLVSYDIWVEGIGYAYDGLFESRSYGGRNPRRSVYAADGSLIYCTRDFPEISDYPSRIEMVEYDGSLEKAYDINGRIWTPGSKGIQIKDGKKSLKH